MSMPKPIPDTYRRITPTLIVDGGIKALEYLGTQAPPREGLAGTPTSLFIYVEDVDATIEQVVKLGATLTRAPQDQFYGDRDGHIVDPFGHTWTIASHVEDVAPDELMRRITELQT